jgi:N-acetylglucosamine-6-phosphate deacetylase
MLALCEGRIFTGEETLEGRAVLLEGGRIRALVSERAVPQGAQRHSLRGGLLAPGFVDVQVNGGGGVLFGAAPSHEGLLAVARAHRRFGTTGLLPTLISADRATLRAALEVVRRALAEPPAPGAARALGLHVEGPFLSPERRGIHERSQLRAFEAEDLALLRSLPSGRVLVTLAPEAVPAGSVRQLSEAGVLVAAGHTQASYEELRAALREGLRGFTHLWNAMPPLAAREPGAVGAALCDPESWCAILADGIHVHPASLRIALAAKPRGRVLLATDAMPPVGCEGMQSFRLGAEEIRVSGGRCTNAEGRLAGSVLDMASAVRNAVALLGVPLEESLRMASSYPAAFLRLEAELGRIAPGLRADLVLLDEELRVRETWVDGVAAGEPTSLG